MISTEKHPPNPADWLAWQEHTSLRSTAPAHPAADAVSAPRHVRPLGIGAGGPGRGRRPGRDAARQAAREEPARRERETTAPSELDAGSWPADSAGRVGMRGGLASRRPRHCSEGFERPLLRLGSRRRPRTCTVWSRAGVPATAGPQTPGLATRRKACEGLSGPQGQRRAAHPCMT
ncbi:hypothetical protein JHW43_002285 [Diplocarpon mali]|nr:hypothetical protein JHW43_002285 [Diplocarpon mali]